MIPYEGVLQAIHKDVTRAIQASILANIYASICAKPAKNTQFKIIQAAIKNEEECAITLEPLTYSSVVTTCGHVFSKEGLLSWISKRITRSSFKQTVFACPLCKQQCTVAFP